MNGHHLILGQLTDFLTGRAIEDTHDERYRQKIARYMVKDLGYLKEEIEPQVELLVQADDKKAIIRVDFRIALSGRTLMIVKYGPGSLITRIRPTIAASRLIVKYEIPFAVVTNGEDALILDSKTGKPFLKGIGNIPSKNDLEKKTRFWKFETISPRRVEMESRILYAYEVDDSCPCDDNICRL